MLHRVTGGDVNNWTKGAVCVRARELARARTRALYVCVCVCVCVCVAPKEEEEEETEGEKERDEKWVRLGSLTLAWPVEVTEEEEEEEEVEEEVERKGSVTKNEPATTPSSCMTSWGDGQ